MSAGTWNGSEARGGGRLGGLPRAIARAAALALALAAATAVAGAVGPGAAGATGAASAAGAAMTHVTYVAGGSIYIDAGRSQGIAVGDTVAVVRDGSTIALLRVSYVSTAKASCDTLRVSAPIQPGDSVRYVARAPVPPPEGPAGASGGTGSAGPPGAALPLGSAPPPSTPGAGSPARAGSSPADSGAAATSAPSPSPEKPFRGRALRGRVGFGWIHISDNAGAPGYSQPSLALRLDGSAAAGAPLDFSVDVRTHRTYQGGATDGETRVYRLAATVRDGASRKRFSLGRQPLPIASSGGLFDGALAQLDGARVSAGVYSGLEPAPDGYDFSTDIVQTGIFAQLRNAAGSPRRWNVGAGLADSRDHGQVNRDFLFAQLFYLAPKLMVSGSQEVDANSGWKRAMGEPLFSSTSTFLMARAEVTRQISVDGGFDNRRNVRLYRDRETPETAFDDRYRQGGWLGASVAPTASVRFGASGRVNAGGSGGTARSWSGTAEAYRLTSLHAIVRLRSTRVDSDAQKGWLHSGGVEVNPWTGVRIGGTVGVQRFTDPLSGTPSRLDWQGLDVDFGLARRWYALLSAEHDRGDAQDRLQTYTSLNWMF